MFTYGRHRMTIDLPWIPKEVEYKLIEIRPQGCGGPDDSTAKATIIGKSVLFRVNVKSEEAELFWRIFQRCSRPDEHSDKFD